MFELSGQVAVVTGAATGIGEAIAVRLAQAGAKVAVADLNLDGAKAVTTRIGPSASAVQCDVSQRASVEAAFAQIVTGVGPIDILINNAGIAGKAAPFWEQTDEDWARIIAINVQSVVNCCRSVVPAMRARGYGRIVNIASIAGKEGNPNMAPYSATKAAVIAMTKSLGKELATDGICVNAISPAVIHTQMLDQLTEAQVGYMTSRIPMQRTGTPEEVAAVAHFLSSRDCSFVTAQCYDVSGGRATY